MSVHRGGRGPGHVSRIRGSVGGLGPDNLLSDLTLSASVLPENSTAGTVIGAIQNTHVGSTLSLTASDGSRVAISGGNLVAGATNANYEADTNPRSITIRETLAGATNSPRDTLLAYTIGNLNDTNPSAFTFTDVSGVATSTLETSNTITIAGLGASDSATAVLTGDASSQMQKNGGAWGSGPFTVVNGDTLAVRHTSAAGSSTAVNSTLTVGTTTDTYTSTTSAGGAVASFPLGINFGEPFRGPDAPFTNLWYGDNFYYQSSIYGANATLPNANRDSEGWPTGVPADSTDGYVYTNIRCPLNVSTDSVCNVTWTGLMDDFQVAGTGVSMTGSGTGGPRVLTYTFDVTSPTALLTVQCKFKPNATTPGKYVKIIPSGRASQGFWNPEFISAFQGFTASNGYGRPIKYRRIVENHLDSLNTNNNIPRNVGYPGSVYNNDVPMEYLLELHTNASRNLHLNLGLKESDSTIATILGLADTWLTNNPSRRLGVESGNENWNDNFYFFNHNTLAGWAVDAADDTNNVAGATVTAATFSGQTITITTSSAHGLATNDRVTLHGFEPWTWYNWYPTEAITVIDSTHFSFVGYSVPPTNATTLGVLRKGASAGDLHTAQLRQAAVRSNHIMDLVAANISPGNLSRVDKILGIHNDETGTTATEIGVSGTAGKHTHYGVGDYCGYDPSATYPIDGAYTTGQFAAILTDWKAGCDSIFDKTEAHRAVTGLLPFGYELGWNRNFHGNAPISSITRGGTGNLTATVTTSSAHNLSTGDGVAVAGVTPSGFNYGDYNNGSSLATVTVLNSTQFTYTMGADPGGNATVVGAYKTDKVCKLWYESQQAHDGEIYKLQEWHARFGTPANYFYMQGPRGNEDFQGRSLYEYFGQTAGIGVGKSAKALAVQNYVNGTTRLPNDLTGTLNIGTDANNGDTVGKLRKYVVGSTIAVQSITGSSPPAVGLLAVATSVTSPDGIAVTIADKTQFTGSGSFTVTFRETHSSFPAPGYHDTSITLVATPPLLKDDFNDNSLDGTKWTTGAGLLGQSAVTTDANNTATESNQAIEIKCTSTTSNRGNSLISVNNVDLTLNPSHFCKAATTRENSNQGMAFGASGGNVLHINRGDGRVETWTSGSTYTSLTNGWAGSLATYTIAAYPWTKFTYDGTNILVYFAPAAASNPPVTSDWVLICTNTWPAAISTTGKIGYMYYNNFGGVNPTTYSCLTFNKAD